MASTPPLQYLKNPVSAPAALMLSMLSMQETVADTYLPTLCSMDRVRLMRWSAKYFTKARFRTAATMPMMVNPTE